MSLCCLFVPEVPEEIEKEWMSERELAGHPVSGEKQGGGCASRGIRKCRGVREEASFNVAAEQKCCTGNASV